MISLFRPFVPPRAQLLPVLERVLYSGQIGEGQEVWDFEKELSAFLGVEYLLAMSSGTAALHVALLLAGVRDGDEVVSTAMTAEPTNMAIEHVRGSVVFADVDPATGNVTADSIAAVLSPRTKAIILVHYAGYPVDLAPIIELASYHGIPVIEDAAHALGAEYRGQRIGVHGDFVAFSFQAIKQLTTVDGGALVVRDSALIPTAKRLRWFGLEKGAPRLSQNATFAGYKYNMNNVAAAIGRVSLQTLDKRLVRNRQIAEQYSTRLRGVRGVDVVVSTDANPSYWLYALLVDRYAEVHAALLRDGIESGKVHKRNDEHQLFSSAARKLIGLDSYYERLIHIPCGWWVTDAEVATVCECIKRTMQQ